MMVSTAFGLFMHRKVNKNSSSTVTGIKKASEFTSRYRLDIFSKIPRLCVLSPPAWQAFILHHCWQLVGGWIVLQNKLGTFRYLWSAMKPNQYQKLAWQWHIAQHQVEFAVRILSFFRTRRRACSRSKRLFKLYQQYFGKPLGLKTYYCIWAEAGRPAVQNASSKTMLQIWLAEIPCVLQTLYTSSPFALTRDSFFCIGSSFD